MDIPFNLGLDGHSDADVLIHALMDALLGAAALPDIGCFFPNTDERYRGASSLVLLKEVSHILRREKYEIVNLDTVIIAEAPVLSPFVGAMKENLAGELEMATQAIGIKCTTGEGLGPTGRGEGIAAYAVALLQGAGRYGP